ncbi:MAG TPA: translation elongation factor Ts [Rudaea sp.]|jgi:elongation factor Ts
MEITASMVKELRERSGAGMMECKKALTENSGDVTASIEWLRKQGLAKADKKASRIAAEGRIVLAQSSQSEAAGHAVLVEVNSETDFVAKDENFVKFADEVAKTALASGAKSVDELKQAKTSYGPTVEEARQWLVAKVGENVQVRRLVRIDSANRVAAYLHGGRIGVLLEMKGGSEELARGLAMHVAAMNPPYISPDNVPADIVTKEKEIALAQMTEKDRAKPAEIQEKMIGGKIRKTLAEMSLTGQAYVLDTNIAVEAALKKEGAEVLGFHRIAVGEGIEKKEEDFAAEVMKQAGLAH